MQNDLSQALHHHQNGRLEQAARIYQAVLSREPRHPDALHLLGVLLLQRGNAEQAVKLIAQAVAIQPKEAAYHCNLAEAYRVLGQLDKAARFSQSALQMRPDYPEAANNLGLILLSQCKAREAVESFRAAIASRPDFAMAHNNLGNALRMAGDIDEAIRCFRRALEINENLPEAHSNLGQLLLEQDQPQEALEHCQTAVRLRPDFPEAHNNLGNVWRDLGEIDKAKACYQEALRLNPQLAMTLNNIGQAFQEEGKLAEALAWYERGLKCDPTSARIHCNLASALQEQERFDEAVDRYELALRFEPEYAEAHNGLGRAYHELGRNDEAVRHFEEAIRRKPELTAAHCQRGELLEELNRFAEAEGCFREALRLRPRSAGACAQLATMLRGKLPEADLQVIEDLLADENRPRHRNTALHFGLAQVLDGKGTYEEAAEQLRLANELRLAEWQRQGKCYVPAEHSRFVDNLLARFTPEFFEHTRGFGSESVRPIFIVGLPRSATTLTEQILASHSQVFGAGELRFARETFNLLAEPTQQTETPLGCFQHMDRASARRLAQHYLARLRQVNADSPRVTDKMPDNYLYVGLLAALFPKAAFIHTRRDLRDVAVSCWMTNFKHIRWANHPEHIGSRFKDYLRVMEHWRRVLPVRFLELDYEETVADLESAARRLVTWCGLEWEPACLTFHESTRPIRTASLGQVRQPIYTRSAGRWRNYENALAELFAHLPQGN